MNRQKQGVLLVVVMTLIGSMVLPLADASPGWFGKQVAGVEQGAAGGSYFYATRYLYSGGPNMNATSINARFIMSGVHEGYVWLAIWEDVAGSPGDILAWSNQIHLQGAASDGWTGNLTLANHNVLNGTLVNGYYWLGWKMDVQNTQIAWGRDYVGGANNGAYKQSTASISSGFPVGFTFVSDRALDIYVNYVDLIPPGSYIEATDDDYSTITPSGSVFVGEGEDQTFTFTTTGGYRIETITVDGATQPITSSYTFENVLANHTITITSTGWGEGVYSRQSVRRFTLLVGLVLLLGPVIYLATRPEGIAPYLYAPAVMVLGAALLYFVSLI
jgi:hypothetical protein